MPSYKLILFVRLLFLFKVSTRFNFSKMTRYKNCRFLVKRGCFKIHTGVSPTKGNQEGDRYINVYSHIVTKSGGSSQLSTTLIASRLSGMWTLKCLWCIRHTVCTRYMKLTWGCWSSFKPNIASPYHCICSVQKRPVPTIIKGV